MFGKDCVFERLNVWQRYKLCVECKVFIIELFRFSQLDENETTTLSGKDAMMKEALDSSGDNPYYENFQVLCELTKKKMIPGVGDCTCLHFASKSRAVWHRDKLTKEKQMDQTKASWLVKQ